MSKQGVKHTVRWLFSWGLALFILAGTWLVYRVLSGTSPSPGVLALLITSCILANVYNAKFMHLEEKQEALQDCSIKVPVELLENSIDGPITINIFPGLPPEEQGAAGSNTIN